MLSNSEKIDKSLIVFCMYEDCWLNCLNSSIITLLLFIDVFVNVGGLHLSNKLLFSFWKHAVSCRVHMSSSLLSLVFAHQLFSSKQLFISKPKARSHIIYSVVIGFFLKLRAENYFLSEECAFMSGCPPLSGGASDNFNEYALKRRFSFQIR